MIEVNILIVGIEEKIDKAGDGESEENIDKGIEKEIEDKLNINIDYKGTGKETGECIRQEETQECVVRQKDTREYVAQNERRGIKKKVKWKIGLVVGKE